MHKLGSTFLETLLRSAGEGILVLDTNRRITHCNPAACRILGVDEAHMIGATPDELAAHWSRITEIPLGPDLTLPTPLIDVRFVTGGPRETLRTLHLDVVDPNAITRAAEARGYVVTDRSIELCGVRFRY